MAEAVDIGPFQEIVNVSWGGAIVSFSGPPVHIGTTLTIHMTGVDSLGHSVSLSTYQKSHFSPESLITVTWTASVTFDPPIGEDFFKMVATLTIGSDTITVLSDDYHYSTFDPSSNVLIHVVQIDFDAKTVIWIS